MGKPPQLFSAKLLLFSQGGTLANFFASPGKIPCSYTLELDCTSVSRVVPESGSLGGFVDTENLVALHVMKDLPDAAWPSDTYLFDGRLIAQPEMHSLVPRG